MSKAKRVVWRTETTKAVFDGLALRADCAGCWSIYLFGHGRDGSTIKGVTTPPTLAAAKRAALKAARKLEGGK